MGVRDYRDAIVSGCRLYGISAPEIEYAFFHGRRWRFDCAWPVAKLAVECHGGTFNAGSHVRGAGIARDAEKLNAATISGWRVLIFTGDQLTRNLGACMDVVKAALTGETDAIVARIGANKLFKE